MKMPEHMYWRQFQCRFCPEEIEQAWSDPEHPWWAHSISRSRRCRRGTGLTLAAPSDPALV